MRWQNPDRGIISPADFVPLAEETGLLVPPQDVAAFASGVDRILSDELWARKLRKQASAPVELKF